jgi:hypothetical protein
MPNYAMVRDNRCIATGTLKKLPDRTDIIEQVNGVPNVGDVLEAGEWVTPERTAPQPSATLTRLAFMGRFTTAELVAIYTAAKSDVRTEIWLDKVKAAEDINLIDPRIKEGLATLEAGGLIGEGRADEISTP